MTQRWFCTKCLIEGALEFLPATNVWAVVDAVRRDHIAVSGDCARTHGVIGIRLQMDATSDFEYEQLKIKAKE